jgi:pyruvyltransferase
MLNTVTRRIAKLRSTARFLAESGPITAFWWRDRPNFGDSLNPVLIAALTGRRVFHVEDVATAARGRRGIPVTVACGSVLQWVGWEESVVWGSGFLDENCRFWRKPGEIRAVRGPLTRDLALNQGVACPAVYGDPALLLPRIHTPRPLSDRSRLGLILHWRDRGDPIVRTQTETDGVRTIDVGQPVDRVVDEICSCDAIASTSLHGVIVAAAYGVPAVWIEISDRVEGRGFKFRDFFASIGQTGVTPLRVTPATSASRLIDAARSIPLDVDLEALLEAFPHPVSNGP